MLAIPLWRLAVEMVVIGVIFAVVAAILNLIIQRLVGNHHSQILLLCLQAFIAASILHLIFELSGTNAWYCSERSRLATHARSTPDDGKFG